MKTSKLKKFESKTHREPSPEAIKQAREVAANMIMSVFDRLPKNSAPVAESLEDLLLEVANPKRAPVIVQTYDGKRLEISNGVTKNLPAEATKNDFTGATKDNSGGEKLSSITTGFTSDELEILRKIQNGEN